MRLQKILNHFKEIISKEYFAFKEPSRVQKANGSSIPTLSWKNQRLRGAHVAWCLKRKGRKNVLNITSV